jgi:cephalosporin-C deacetylase-like acetyl esterase
MILRAMRALQFVKTLPEWNGEKLVVSGGSQGGFQSLVVAGLDSDVTEVQAQVPWFCDIARKENDSKIRGWLPEYVDGLAYFDATYHAKRIKGKVTISSGLGDFGCPPSGHVLLFRAIPTQKRWIATQGRTHKFTPQNAPEYVLQEKAR